MELNYAVVHDLRKESGTLEAQEHLATALLSVQDPVVVELVTKIVRLIGQRENTAYYGVFRDDPASTRVPDIIKGYCGHEEPASDRFLYLTKACMIALKDRAQSQSFATGGYLLFADYINVDRRFLLVAMIKQRDGITMRGLVPTSITELDLSKLHQVARISFDRLSEYEEAPEDREDLTYLTFVSPPQNRQVAGYFIAALGCEQGTASATATNAAIEGTRAFFDARESIRSEGIEARRLLMGLLRMRADNEQRVGLREIIEIVRPKFPLVEASDLADELTRHLQSDSYRVPAEFPVSAKAVDRYTRFKYQSDELKVEIEKALVTRSDIGPFYFDEENRRLVISEYDFIVELGDALRDDA